MVDRYVRDNGHMLTIIHVNPIIKESYFYCLALDPVVLCDRCTMYWLVAITALLVAWATRG